MAHLHPRLLLLLVCVHVTNVTTRVTASNKLSSTSMQTFSFVDCKMVEQSMLSQIRWDALSIVALSGAALTDATGVVDYGHRHAQNSGPCWADGVANLLPVAQRHNTTMLMMVQGRGIASMLANSTACYHAVRNLSSAVHAAGVNGIMLDFEGAGSSSQKDFSKFVRMFKAALGPDMILATAVSAFEKKGFGAMYDFAALADDSASDLLFQMVYGFEGMGGMAVGPSPYHFGKYGFDVYNAVQKAVAVPGVRSKLFVGVAWYGVEFSVGGEAGQPPRMHALLQPPKQHDRQQGYRDMAEHAMQHGKRWDNVTKTSWYQYYNATENTWKQGWFDDPRSCATKYNLARAVGARGVGVWELIFQTPEMVNCLKACALGPCEC